MARSVHHWITSHSHSRATIESKYAFHVKPKAMRNNAESCEAGASVETEDVAKNELQSSQFKVLRCQTTVKLNRNWLKTLDKSMSKQVRRESTSWSKRTLNWKQFTQGGWALETWELMQSMQMIRMQLTAALQANCISVTSVHKMKSISQECMYFSELSKDMTPVKKICRKKSEHYATRVSMRQLQKTCKDTFRSSSAGNHRRFRLENPYWSCGLFCEQCKDCSMSDRSALPAVTKPMDSFLFECDRWQSSQAWCKHQSCQFELFKDSK